MFDSFDNFIQTFAGFTSALTVALLVVLAVLVVIRRIRARRQLLFDPWSDLRPQPDEVLGRSVGEMLLHRLGTIQSIHESSIDQVEISNTYRDIPIFSQGLDEDLELLGSAELGSTPGAITALLVFVLRAFPFLSPPTRLRGSIHRYGERHRLQAILHNYPNPATGRRSNHLWEVQTADSVDGNIPEAVEELAYRIYLDLLRERAFKSWECFRDFTRGLGAHIRYMDLGKDLDGREAEKHYRAALNSEPQNHVVAYNLGVLIYMRYQSSRSNEEALDLFRRALTAPNDRLRARANSAMANAMLTRVHRFQEGGQPDLEEARYLADAALALQPDLDACAKASAYAHHQLGEWLHRNAERQPDPARARTEALDHLRRAREGYERTLRLNPAHFVAANNLANLQLEWSKLARDPAERRSLLEGAKLAAERALRISPGYHHAHDNLGNIRLELGDRSGALLAFQAALRFQPNYPEALNDIALVHLDTGYPAASAGQVREHHVAALALTAPESGRQRAKLCAQLGARARALQAAGHLVSGVGPDLFVDPSCTCRDELMPTEIRGAGQA